MATNYLDKKNAIQPAVRDELKIRDKALAGDIVFSVSPSTVSTTPLATAWTRTVNVNLESAAGDVHEWFNKAITTGVSIADTSSAGTATIPSTTLTFANGKASVVVSGDAQAWLGGTAQVETITCTGAPSSDGDITLEITAAGMTGSPHDVVVPLVALTHTSVTLVADKVVETLNADATFAAFFTASNVAGAVAMTAITPAANDATMAFAFTDTDTTSTTFGASANTTAGVAKETDTLTIAQAAILGYTIASKTSIETFTA